MLPRDPFSMACLVAQTQGRPHYEQTVRERVDTNYTCRPKTSLRSTNP